MNADDFKMLNVGGRTDLEFYLRSSAADCRFSILEMDYAVILRTRSWVAATNWSIWSTEFHTHALARSA